VLTHRDPVDEHRQQVDLGEVPAEDLAQASLGGPAEPARDGRTGRSLQFHVTHRGLARSVPTARQARHHAAERHLIEQVSGGEDLVGGQGHFLATGGAHPGPLDEQPLLNHPSHQVGYVGRAGTITGLPLETVGVEQRHEQLEVLILAGMRRGRQQQEMPGHLAENLSDAIPLRLLQLDTEVVG
jgi:hypothetical protein